VLIGEKFQGEFKKGYENAFVDFKKLKDDGNSKLRDLKFVEQYE